MHSRFLPFLAASAALASVLPTSAQITGTGPYTLASGTDNESNYTLGLSSLTQTGGTLNVSGTFKLGVSNAATYSLSAGTASIATFQLGFQSFSSAGYGLVNQSGGALTVGNLNLGTSGSSYGRYTLTGGTLDASVVTIIANSADFSALTLAGGQLTTSLIDYNTHVSSVPANTRLNLQGGTLRASADTTAWINPNITTYIGYNTTTGLGAVFDTNGHNVAFGTNLLHDSSVGTDGGLTKKGAGTLTLLYVAGNYNGATTLQQGTLSIHSLDALGTATNALNFSGGTLQIKSQAGSPFALMTDFGSHTLNTTTFNGGIDIADATNTFTMSQSLSGPGGLNKYGAGTLVLTGNISMTGGTNLTAGTLSVSSSANLGSATAPLSFTGGTFRVTGTALQDFGSHLFDGTVYSGAFDIADANNTFTLSQALSGTGTLTKLGAGTLVLAGASTRSGATTLSAGTLRLGNSLTLQNSAVTVAGGALGFGTVSSATLGGLSGAQTALSLTNSSSAPVALTVGGSTNTTFTTALSGTGSLTKTGTGTLTLDGSTTYTGATTLQGGELVVSSLASNAVNFSGGTLGVAGTALTSLGAAAVNGASFNGGLDIANAANIFTLGSSLSGTGSLTKLGAGTLVLSGTNTLSGGLYLYGGTLSVSSAANLGASTAPLTFNGAALFVAGTSLQNLGNHTIAPSFNGGFNIADASNTFTLSQSLSNSPGSLTKTGPGTLALTGINLYSGKTYLYEGTLEFNNNNAIGDGSATNKLVIDGGTLRWAAGWTGGVASRLDPIGRGGATFDTNGNNVAFGSVITGVGSVTKTGSGTLFLGGNYSWTGGTAVNAGTLQLTGTPSGGLGVIRGNVIVNSGTTFSSVTANSYGTATGAKIDSITLNGGSIDHTAAGDQGWGVAYTLNGGLMQSNGGVSSATTASKFSFGNNTSVNVTADTTLAGRVDFRADGGTTNTNFTVASGQTLTVSAALTSSSGAAGFTKLGAGTMTLSGDSTYASPTTLSAGTVRINNSSGSVFGTSAVTLAPGATLTGGGSFTGSLQLGGTLSPGNSPGTITTGDSTWFGGAGYLWQINNGTGTAGTGYDFANIGGILTITANPANPFRLSLVSLLADNNAGNVINFDASQNHHYTVATASGGISGFSASAFTLDTSGFTNDLLGGTWSLGQIGNDLRLDFTASAIPEPSTYAALAGVAALGLSAWRKRRRRA